jgi:hypothetical protein
MKKLITILFLILPVVAIAGITNMTPGEVIDNTTSTISNFKAIGFVDTVKSHWYLVLLSLIGIGQLIVKITPSKHDDEWYKKYILVPLHYVASFLNLDKLGNNEKK